MPNEIETVIQRLNDAYRETLTSEELVEMDRVNNVVYPSLVHRLKTENFSDENEIRQFFDEFPKKKLTWKDFESIVAENPIIIKYIQCIPECVWQSLSDRSERNIAKMLIKNGALYRYLPLQYQKSLVLLLVTLSGQRNMNNPDIIACIPIEALQLHVLTLVQIFPDLDEKFQNNPSTTLAYNNLKATITFQLLKSSKTRSAILLGLSISGAICTILLSSHPALFILSFNIFIIALCLETYYSSLKKPITIELNKISSTLREYGLFNVNQHPVLAALPDETQEDNRINNGITGIVPTVVLGLRSGLNI